MDSSLILIFCLLGIVPMTIGILTLNRQRVHRLSQQRSGFGSAIKMTDGRICLKVSDGSVVIKPRTLYNWFVIVVLGGAAFFLFIISGGFLIFDPIFTLDALISGGARLIFYTLVIGLALFFAVRRLRQPSITINANSRALEIRRGSIDQQILFSSFAYISTTPPITNSGRSPDFWSKLGGSERVICIQVMLDDGEMIKLGSVSGEARATAITRLVAEVTGAQVR